MIDGSWLKLMLVLLVVVPAVVFAQGPLGSGNSLEERLLREDATALAEQARRSGDPVRGAIVFYQPYLTCTKCHLTQDQENPLGPDLSKPNPDQKTTAVHLAESILQPSKVIRKGYEPVVVYTDQGKPITGLLVEETDDTLTLRDPANDNRILEIPVDSIEEQMTGRTSVMPAGLINTLTSRQQFLDLVCYLIEISEKGPERARELEPAPQLYAAPEIPEYEQNIDHAGMIADLDQEAYERGQTIYSRLCVNCHGTHDQPGSLPTSLRFASGQFKNGFHPYAMYQTLTRGFAMMMPQTWMVPQQKYDVIHYVRQAYLREHNPSQFLDADQAYLDGLPKGDTRGPEPSNFEPWIAMDYGPHLIASYEIGDDGTNFAYKGIAVRLDPGPGGVSRGSHWMMYDEDTLRVAAAWEGQGFIDWRAILFDGQHNVHPRIVGQVHAANPTGPGWGRPSDGRFDDVRLRGRDDRPYGPLPRDWARYRGLYHWGNQVLIAYTVGETEILEMPAVETTGNVPVWTRTLHVGPRERDLVLQVAQHKQGSAGGSAEHSGRFLVLGDDRSEKSQVASQPVRFRGDTHFRLDETVGQTVRDRSGHGRDGQVLLGQPTGRAGTALVAGVDGLLEPARWHVSDQQQVRLVIPAGADALRLQVWFAATETAAAARGLADARPEPQELPDLLQLTRGGPARWPDKLVQPIVRGDDSGPFAIDTMTHPEKNPWFCRTRFTGLDFVDGGHSAVVCSWDGDVWLVSGIDDPEDELTWQRIASGLFQPLGLKVVDGQIYVSCRDQIVILRDLNGDGETDFYECFNNDHQVTDHFHEFAMGLQTDAAGNFYYAKAARHAKQALVPHHGTLLRVSKDGTRTDILDKGFRAPNGICVNPDGTFFVTDQEGHWTPKNRINWLRGDGRFWGNFWGYHDVTDESDDAMEQPVCWITNSLDRSPAELMWVDSPAWGPLDKSLLQLSYGYGKMYIVPHEIVDGQMQGGMSPLPLGPFPTGVMRGRYHPGDQQLYACGMFAWASNQQEPGGFYRIRRTGKPAYVPIGLNARRTGMRVTFSDPLDRETVCDAENWSVKTWHLRRSSNYGSDHLNERPLEVREAALSDDGRTVTLQIPDIHLTWCMEIKYRIRGADGTLIDNLIHNTIHAFGADED